MVTFLRRENLAKVLGIFILFEIKQTLKELSG